MAVLKVALLAVAKVALKAGSLESSLVEWKVIELGTSLADVMERMLVATKAALKVVEMVALLVIC